MSREPGPGRRRGGGRWLLAACSIVLAGGCAGCTDSSARVSPGARGERETASQYQTEIFDTAIGNLRRVEEFGPMEMLDEIVHRLNQWQQTQQPPADWRPDPMLATLPEHLADLEAVKGLDRPEFTRYDGFALQEAVWLRDVSNWTRGSRLDDLSRAAHLFDWTVRNIQLEPAPADTDDAALRRAGQLPVETLLFGRGTALERAWVFVLLARQQGLDAAVLGLADPEDPAGRPPRPWAVGVLSEGSIYLFDPSLSLPVPGPDGIRLDDDGQLQIRPATLAQAVEDEAVVGQLDVGRNRPYRLKFSDLDRVVALIEASPPYLARRMKLVESHLAGDQKVVLTTNASGQAERWKARPEIHDARLWTLPYETLRQHEHLGPAQQRQRHLEWAPFRMGPDSALWKGRVLHLKGVFTGEGRAARYYQMARPSDRELADLANQLYRAARENLEELPDENGALADARLRQAAAEQARLVRPLLVRAKQNASYWLGLIAFEQGNHRSAINYFIKRTLEAWPGGPWTHGAKYNLARSFEASGQAQKAIELYRADPTSPGYHGNFLRARWLEGQLPEAGPSEPKLPEPPEDVSEPQPAVPEPEPAVPEPNAAAPSAG